MKQEKMMPWGQAVMTSVFGILLPTADVITDWLLVGQLLTHSIALNVRTTTSAKHNVCEPSNILFQLDWCPNDNLTQYGLICMICPTLSWVFVTYHWYKMEPGWRGRTKALPLLLLQVYPQFKCAQVLYQGLVKKNPQWQAMKSQVERDLITVEPFTG